MPVLRRKGPARALAAVGIVCAVGTLVVSPAFGAAPALSSSGLSSSVSGSSVTVRTTITANPGATASMVGICARNAAGHGRDFPFSTNTALTTTGTTFTKTATLTAGTYTYWSCAKIDGRWSDIGERKAFTVGETGTLPPTSTATPTSTSTPTSQPSPTSTAPSTPSTTTSTPTSTSPSTSTATSTSAATAPSTSTPAVTTPAPTGSTTSTPSTTISIGTATSSTVAPTAPADPVGPSGEPMPVGNLPGWTQVLSDDFTAPLSSTKWFSPYSGEIPSAPGAYWNPSQVKVRDGKLVLETAKIGDRWTSGGIMAKQDLAYGKVLIRTRIDKAAGVKYAHLLWPQSPDTWYTGGEIDFAEDGGGNRTTTTGTVIWFVNKVAGGKTQIQKATSVDFSQWHTLGVEWSPGKVVYTLDGAPFGTVENANVPSGVMKMALQTEALVTCSQWNTCVNSSTPALTNAEFDWVALYTRNR